MRRLGLSHLAQSTWATALAAPRPEPIAEPAPLPITDVATLEPPPGTASRLPSIAEVDPFAEPVATTLTAEATPTPEAADKHELLTVLRSEVAGCTRCPELAATRRQTVFADGDPHAELCFVGEAPGADEDREGLPFVGRAGQLLTKIIEACGLGRDQVYICNVLKCRPPENRDPATDETHNCAGYLARQLELVRPKFLVALGKHPAAWLLGRRPDQLRITQMRGQIHDYRGIPVMITFHPSYLLRCERDGRGKEVKKQVWEDMKEVMRRLGRPVDR